MDHAVALVEAYLRVNGLHQAPFKGSFLIDFESRLKSAMSGMRH